MNDIEVFYNQVIRNEYATYMTATNEQRAKYVELGNQSKEEFERKIIEKFGAEKLVLYNDVTCDLSQFIINDFYEVECSLKFLLAVANPTFALDDILACTRCIVYAYVGLSYIVGLEESKDFTTSLEMIKKYYAVQERSNFTKLLAGYCNYWRKQIDENL